MAPDGDAGSPSGEVSGRLGRAVNSFGPARASLISKGLIYAPEHGVVAFTVPGMAPASSRGNQSPDAQVVPQTDVRCHASRGSGADPR